MININLTEEQFAQMAMGYLKALDAMRPLEAFSYLAQRISNADDLNYIKAKLNDISQIKDDNNKKIAIKDYI